MRYPDDFDTPTFPAGKRIAVTRVIASVLMVVFLLIIFTCGVLLWARNSVQDHPFLVSINEITGQWKIVGHNHEKQLEMSTIQTLQESVLTKFMQAWFMLTSSDEVNNALWQQCDRQTECNINDNADVNSKKCTVYCLAGDTAYAAFITDVLPDYRIRAMVGEMLTLDLSSVELAPIRAITENGSAWQIRARIVSNINPPIEILGYATVAKNSESYHKTLGYYVEKFDVYRIK